MQHVCWFAWVKNIKTLQIADSRASTALIDVFLLFLSSCRKLINLMAGIVCDPVYSFVIEVNFWRLGLMLGAHLYFNFVDEEEWESKIDRLVRGYLSLFLIFLLPPFLSPLPSLLSRLSFLPSSSSFLFLIFYSAIGDKGKVNVRSSSFIAYSRLNTCNRKNQAKTNCHTPNIPFYFIKLWNTSQTVVYMFLLREKGDVGKASFWLIGILVSLKFQPHLHSCLS